MISKKLIIVSIGFLLVACDDLILDSDVNIEVEPLPAIKIIKEDVVDAVGSVFQKVEYEDADDSAYEYVVRFDKSGMFHWNNMPVALGDPEEEWLKILGKPSRASDAGTYLWDDLGITIYTASNEKVLRNPEMEGTVSGFSIRFDDRYEDLGQYSIGRDPGWSPIGYFKGLFRFDDVWVDRDRKVSEFLNYESTSTLEDSFDRSLVFRDIFVNADGQKVSFSITQGLSKAFPEGPNNISAYIIR